jgi:hypothetical protein
LVVGDAVELKVPEADEKWVVARQHKRHTFKRKSPSFHKRSICSTAIRICRWLLCQRTQPKNGDVPYQSTLRLYWEERKLPTRRIALQSEQTQSAGNDHAVWKSRRPSWRALGVKFIEF